MGDTSAATTRPGRHKMQVSQSVTVAGISTSVQYANGHAIGTLLTFDKLLPLNCYSAMLHSLVVARWQQASVDLEAYVLKPTNS